VPAPPAGGCAAAAAVRDGRTQAVGAGALLAGRFESLRCAPFDGGCPSTGSGSPGFPPLQKRHCPALADRPKGETKETPGNGGDGNPGTAAAGGTEASASCSSITPASAGELAASAGDWRMVLYHDQNVILYNPNETPQLRSRRLTLEEAPEGTVATGSFGRCPLCRQTIDSRFAFAAQAYFDLLQGVFRSTRASAMHEPSEEVDLLAEEADLYRILGIPRNARIEDIKRAYRKRSLRYHPDKNQEDPDAKRKFQKIAEAFSVLSDEHKRAKYDKSGDMDLDDFDVEQFMNMVNASGLKYRKSATSVAPDPEMEDAEPDAEQIGDMMEDLEPQAIGDRDSSSNPFLLAPDTAAPVVASEGGAEAEAAAAAALRHLPAGLLNTGYYARFFTESQQLGSGSFGAVYLCNHVLDDLKLGSYAVKKVPVGDNKVWLRDMVREVKTFERLHHPNIVEYKHSWLELSRTSLFCPLVPFLFILMQYCNGGSLEELIWHEGDPDRPKPSLSVVQIWHILLDVLLGLQHLHRQGILHRDLKPTNILLQCPDEIGRKVPGGRGATMRAMLSDFGTAAPFGEPPTSCSSARGYTGTVEYTAPELLPAHGDERREYTEKSDMWSMGIVLYAMCFSSLPFHNDDPHELKGLIRRFVAERQGRPPGPLAGGLADEAAAEEWLPPDVEGRLGPLRLVLAALLAVDADRRPAASNLLDNPVFRRQAARHVRRSADDASLLDV